MSRGVLVLFALQISLLAVSGYRLGRRHVRANSSSHDRAHAPSVTTPSDYPHDALGVELFHTDLSFLAYNVWAQTVVQPQNTFFVSKDPKVANGKSGYKAAVRRWAHLTVNDPMERGACAGDAVGGAPCTGSVGLVRPDLIRGPWTLRGSTGSAPDAVQKPYEPILYRYSQIAPSSHVLLGSKSNSYRAYVAPLAITGSIGETRVVFETSPAVLSSARLHHVEGAADKTDILVAFEGVTGSPGNNAAPGQRSIMGFVLGRKVSATSFTVHVSFRGTRSGGLSGEAWKEINIVGKGVGNADARTDFATAFATIPAIGGVHPVHGGMGYAVLSCLPGIFKAFEDVHHHFRAVNNGVPTHITTTGHSLGGGNAMLFASSVTLGKATNAALQNSGIHPSWDAAFATIGVYPLSAPAVGSGAWATAIAAALSVPRRDHLAWSCAVADAHCTPAFVDAGGLSTAAAAAVLKQPTLVRLGSICDPVTYQLQGSGAGKAGLAAYVAVYLVSPFIAGAGPAVQAAIQALDINPVHVGYSLHLDVTKNAEKLICTSQKWHEQEHVRTQLLRHAKGSGDEAAQTARLAAAVPNAGVRDYTSLFKVGWHEAVGGEEGAKIPMPELRNADTMRGLFSGKLAKELWAKHLHLTPEQATHFAMPALPTTFAEDNALVVRMVTGAYKVCAAAAPATPAETDCMASDDAARSVAKTHRLGGHWKKGPFDGSSKLFGWKPRQFYFECDTVNKNVALHYFDDSKGEELKGAGVVVDSENGAAVAAPAIECAEAQSAAVSRYATLTSSIGIAACLKLRVPGHDSKHGTKDVGWLALVKLDKPDGAPIPSAKAAAAFNADYKEFATACAKRYQA